MFLNTNIKNTFLQATKLTIEHYEREAEAFWRGTRDHDVSQNYDEFLKSLEGKGPFSILDFGCGPGRDLRYFRSLGHNAIGLEGSKKCAAMAREYSGCEVLLQDFISMDLPSDYFDGIFANAALFHVPSLELPRILRELFLTLKPEGILFSSNPHGNNQEGFNGDRYGCFFDLETTGVNVVKDRIVEISIIKINTDNSEDSKTDHRMWFNFRIKDKYIKNFDCHLIVNF